MQKVAIYCRLSVEDSNKSNSSDDSESIQNQKILLTKYAIEKNWAIYKIYSDDDYSGLDKDRPEFNMMLKDAEDGKFDIILCKSQSRFTRDMELVERYINNKFIEWGIRFLSITDNADTAEKGNRKSRQINGLVNEWYCEDISEAIKATFRSKMQDGAFIGSFASYGYKKDPVNKNRLIIDDEAANIVKLIYDLYLEGYGTQHIAQILNERGISNPAVYKQNQGLHFRNASQNDKYGLWNKTTVKRILKNELYIGNMVQGRRKKVSYKSQKIISTEKSQWCVVKGTHEAIIDKRTFYIVQERIAKRKRSCGTGQAHILATKARCMDCRSTMNKVTSSGGYVYLRCRLYTAYPGKRLCTSHTVRLDQLLETVKEKVNIYIRSLTDDKNVASRLLNEEEVDMRVKRLKMESSVLERDIAEKDRVLRNLYLDKLKELISEKHFMELNKSFIEEKEKLEKRYKKISDDIVIMKEKADSLDKWVSIVQKYRDFDELNRTMVNELVDFIEVGEKDQKNGEQKIRVHWLF